MHCTLYTGSTLDTVHCAMYQYGILDTVSTLDTGHCAMCQQCVSGKQDWLFAIKIDIEILFF